MDQRSLCLFLALKGLSARAVSNELTAIFGADSITYSTVTKSFPIDATQSHLLLREGVVQSWRRGAVHLLADRRALHSVTRMGN
jgi:hypothetical protein